MKNMETFDLSKRKWIKKTSNGVEVHLKIYPSSNETSVKGVKSRRLRVNVSSDPEKGRANRELIGLFSNKLGLERSLFKIIRGSKSRKKTLFVEGDSSELMEKMKHIK